MWPLLSLALAADPALHRDPALHEGTLPNGLTWYARQLPGEDVHVRLVIGAGSVAETDDQRGAAHLLRHLAARTIPGALVGDATPERAWTQSEIDVTVPPDGLAAALAVLAKPLDFTACDATLAEVNAEPALDPLYTAVSTGSRYADRPSTGPAPGLTCAAAHTFADRWYRPRAMAVIVIGDLDPEAAQAAVARAFGGLPDRGGGRAPIVQVPHTSTHTVDLPAGDDGPFVLITAPSIRAPVRTSADLKRHDAEAAEIALWSRLGRLPTIGGLQTQGGIWLNPLPGHEVEEVEILAAELKRLLRDGFSDAEAADASTALQKQLAHPRRWPPLAERWIEACADAFLGDPTALLTDPVLTTRPALGDITRRDLTRALRRGPVGERGRVTIVAGSADSALRADDARDLLRHVKVPPVPSTPLIWPRPTPVAPGPRAPDPVTSITSWTLPNGVRVALLPTEGEPGLVHVTALSHTDRSPADDAFDISRVASDSGVAHDSTLDLYRRRLVTGAEASIGFGPAAVQIHGTGPAAATLELIYARLTAQQFTEAAAARHREIETRSAHRQERTPYERFEDAWTHFLPSSDETIARLTAANVEASYQRSIDGPFAIAIVGAITPAALEPLLAQWVATLPAPTTGADAAAPPPTPVATDLTLPSDNPDRAELGLRWEVASWYSADENTTLDAAIRLLNDQLRTNLLDLGDGDVWADGGPNGDLAISVRLTCKPDQLVALEAAIRAQVAAFAENPPASDAVAALRARGRAPYDSATLSERLAEALLDGRPLADALVPQAPTPADIQALTHRLLTEGVLIRVVMTP